MKISPTNHEIYQRVLEEQGKECRSEEAKVILSILEYIFRPKEISDDYDLGKELGNFLSSVAKNKGNEMYD